VTSRIHGNVVIHCDRNQTHKARNKLRKEEGRCCLFIKMAKQIDDLLRKVEWTGGFHIPLANDENKALEKQVTRILYS
jgi:hypothetical protein